MSDGKTYGIAFPFQDSMKGTYLRLTETSNDEIRTDLIHLLLTRKGTRYFLPNFGTRLYEYIFEPMDSPTFNNIESDIRDSCERYMPNLKITNITIKAASDIEEMNIVTTQGEVIDRTYTVPKNNETLDHTAVIRIDYVISNDVFNSRDFIILNI
jgi:phage baseplate assembly protein W